MSLSYDQAQLDRNPIGCQHGVDINRHCKRCDAYFHRTSQKDPPKTLDSITEEMVAKGQDLLKGLPV